MINGVVTVDGWRIDEFNGRGGASLFTAAGRCHRGHGDARVMSGKDRFDRRGRAGVYGGKRADGGYALSCTGHAALQGR
jgi:hypothetical protein